MNKLYFHISLDGIEPMIWRRFTTVDGHSFDLLHDLLQAIMGWQGIHLYSFEFNGKTFMPLEDAWNSHNDDSVEESAFVLLSSLDLKPKSSFGYQYDFGDSWKHTITLEKIEPLDEELEDADCCIAGERACPPEDIGGTHGYYQLCEALANIKHPNREQYEESGFLDYEPDFIDIDAINKRIEWNQQELEQQMMDEMDFTDEAYSERSALIIHPRPIYWKWVRKQPKTLDNSNPQQVPCFLIQDLEDFSDESIDGYLEEIKPVLFSYMLDRVNPNRENWPEQYDTSRLFNRWFKVSINREVVDLDDIAENFEFPYMPAEQSAEMRSLLMNIVEKQIISEDPPETKATYTRLLSEGCSEEVSREMIASVVAAEICDIESSKESFDRERYIERLQALPEVLPYED